MRRVRSARLPVATLSWSFLALLGSVPGDRLADGCGERGPSAPEGGLVLGRVEHEWLLELVGHLGQLSHHGVDQPEGAHGELGNLADTDGVVDLGGDEIEERARGDSLGAGQVPYLADGTLVGAEGGQP